MNQHQILYSNQMILAKLAGRKTVTRRPVKPQPEYASMFSEFRYQDKKGEVHRFANDDGMLIDEHYEKQRCPYGQPGDRLWTRENFKFEYGITLQEAGQMAVKYQADQQLLKPILTDSELAKWQKWKKPYANKSKLHIFRSLSRFLDEVTEIGVERVQSITENEAVAEGIYLDNELKKYVAGPDAFCLANSPKHSFQLLWQTMYKDEEFDWHNNPWVWVIRYRPLAVNETNNQNFQPATSNP